MAESIHTLCLSSGGGCGYVHVGFIEALTDRGRLTPTTDTVVGCSIGVVVGLCWVLGMTPAEIEETLFHLNDESVISLKGVVSMVELYGLDDGEYLCAFFYDILLGRGMDPQLTLAGLLEHTGKRLLAVGFNLSRTELCVFGPETHPELRVVDALRASTAIPIAFAPFRHRGDFFVDGAIRSPYPIKVAQQDAVARSLDTEGVVGSNIVCSVSGGTIDSVGSYLERVMYVCTTTQGTDELSTPLDGTCIHTVDTPTTLSFAQTRADGSEMRARAHAQTLRWLDESQISVGDA